MVQNDPIIVRNKYFYGLAQLAQILFMKSGKSIEAKYSQVTEGLKPCKLEKIPTREKGGHIQPEKSVF